MAEAAPLYFVGPDNSYWSVHEIRDDAQGTQRALIFVSEAGFRRVRTYPADWRELDPAGLWALSWAR